ncbi:hypothetical protein [Mycobacterium sp. SA01]|uniref:hypothetical protein n=1 Tax=Mycobacterium sp. SA01 TaxID=3238820 RepID=UPI00351AB49A
MKSFFDGPVLEGSNRLYPGNPGRIEIEFWTPGQDDPPVHIDVVRLVIPNTQEEVWSARDIDIVGHGTKALSFTIPAKIFSNGRYWLVAEIDGEVYKSNIEARPSRPMADWEEDEPHWEAEK